MRQPRFELGSQRWQRRILTTKLLAHILKFHRKLFKYVSYLKLMMNWNKCRDYGLLPLRLALGIVFLMHGSQKVFGLFGGPGLDGTINFVSSLGFPVPALFGILLAFVELLGGLSILLGFFARYFSLLIIVDMLLALLLVHYKNGFFAGNNGYELVFVLLLGALSIVMLGTKKWSLDKALFNKEF